MYRRPMGYTGSRTSGDGRINPNPMQWQQQQMMPPQRPMQPPQMNQGSFQQPPMGMQQPMRPMGPAPMPPQGMPQQPTGPMPQAIANGQLGPMSPMLQNPDPRFTLNPDQAQNAFRSMSRGPQQRQIAPPIGPVRGLMTKPPEG